MDSALRDVDMDLRYLCTRASSSNAAYLEHLALKERKVNQLPVDTVAAFKCVGQTVEARR